MAALTVELHSTNSEVERASASAESLAAAAIEAKKERMLSQQGLNERLKASEDTIEQLSVREPDSISPRNLVPSNFVQECD